MNGLTHEIVTAGFLKSILRKYQLKTASDTVVSVATISVALAKIRSLGAGKVIGASLIGSWLTSGNPIGWLLDFLDVVLATPLAR